jgi:hypothetical protein
LPSLAIADGYDELRFQRGEQVCVPHQKFFALFAIYAVKFSGFDRWR